MHTRAHKMTTMTINEMLVNMVVDVRWKFTRLLSMLTTSGWFSTSSGAELPAPITKAH